MAAAAARRAEGMCTSATCVLRACRAIDGTSCVHVCAYIAPCQCANLPNRSTFRRPGVRRCIQISRINVLFCKGLSTFGAWLSGQRLNAGRSGPHPPAARLLHSAAAQRAHAAEEVCYMEDRHRVVASRALACARGSGIGLDQRCLEVW